ncbi:MAG TPA: MFS transporter [Candidatus Dormibacteraeota bacterium]|nr:MFS transporter [Candidatus Dormibacteraeota bacterium]
MRGRQLFLATMAFAISFALWGVVSALAPRFRELYGLTETQTALAVAIPVLLGALFRIPMGILTDRIGGRYVFAALLLFGIVPAAAIALVHSYAMLLIGGLLIGLAGSSFAIGIAFTTRWFPPEQQGLALGIFGAGNIGQSVAVFFAPQIARLFGWESVFWIFGIVSALWGVAFWMFARDAGPVRKISMERIVEVLVRQRLSWLLAFFYFITFGGFVAMSIYLPTLLKGQFGLTLEDAGMRTAGFVVLATAMRPVGGWLSDRIGGSQVLTIVYAVIAGFALCLISTNMVLFTVGALGAAAMLGLGNGAVFKLVPHFFAADVGTVTGLVGALGGLGGFFPPLVLGVLKQMTGSYAAGFVLLGVFALVALSLNLTIIRRGGMPRAASAS